MARAKANTWQTADDPMIGRGLFFVTVFLSAGAARADDEAVMLGQPPYPSGYTKPVRRPSAELRVENYSGTPSAYCAFLDVGENGAVTNVHAVLSTGSQANDDVIHKWIESQQYIPATLNGKPIKVRTMFGYSIGQMPPEKANYCRWDMCHPDS